MKKKGKISSEEKVLANFLANSGVWQTSVNTLFGSTKFFDNYCGSYRINSVTPKKLLKTQIFEKRQTLKWKEFLACFISHYRVWQTSRDNIWWSTRYYDVYCGSYSVNSVTPKKLLKKQLFEKKGKSSSEEKFLSNFLAHSGVWQTSVNTLYGSTKFFDNYCGSYRINSVTPKKLLKTQIFEKRQTLKWKEFLACFFSHSRVWKTSGDKIRGSTRYSDFYCGSYSVNSVTPKKLLKTQLFEKKANFPVKKSFWPVFSLILECDKPAGRIYEYPQSNLTNFFEVKGLILLHLRSCWKHKILKRKAKFPEKKSFCCIFSRFIECGRPQ